MSFLQGLESEENVLCPQKQQHSQFVGVQFKKAHIEKQRRRGRKTTARRRRDGGRDTRGRVLDCRRSQFHVPVIRCRTRPLQACFTPPERAGRRTLAAGRQISCNLLIPRTINTATPCKTTSSRPGTWAPIPGCSSGSRGCRPVLPGGRLWRGETPAR